MERRVSLRFARSERNYSIERDGTPTLSRNCANSIEREVSVEHRVSARNPSRFEPTKGPIKGAGGRGEGDTGAFAKWRESAKD